MKENIEWDKLLIPSPGYKVIVRCPKCKKDFPDEWFWSDVTCPRCETRYKTHCDGIADGVVIELKITGEAK